MSTPGWRGDRSAGMRVATRRRRRPRRTQHWPSPSGRVISYIFAGSGGHVARPPRAGLPAKGDVIGTYELAVDPIFELRYLTINVTMGDVPVITGQFHCLADPAQDDSFSLDLRTGVLT